MRSLEDQGGDTESGRPLEEGLINALLHEGVEEPVTIAER